MPPTILKIDVVNEAIESKSEIITRVNKKSEFLSENINLIGETLCIKDGKNLTDTDFSKIKDFLKSSNDVILSKDSDNITSFKKIAKINDFNEQEVFENTDAKDIILKEYDQKKNIFIKSKLPLKHAIKIGVSGLKTKPLRLLFTIILCSVSFLLFGLLSTMTFYDSENIFKDTLEKTSPEYVRLGKEYLIKEKNYFGEDVEPFEYEGYYQTSFYEEDFNEIKNKYGKDTFYALDLYTSFSTQKSNNKYYYDYFSTYAYISEDSVLFNKITGSYPKNDNEIVLSSFIVDSMIYYNVYDSKNSLLNLRNRDDILNKELTFGNRKYKVVGYFDSGEIDQKYNVLKENEDSSLLQRDFMNHIVDSLHLVAFVTENEMKNLSVDPQTNSYYTPSITDYTHITYKLKQEEKFAEYSNASYMSNLQIDNSQIIGDKLNNDEVYVTPSLYAELIINKYGDKIYFNSKYEKIYNKAVNIQIGGEYKNDEFIRYSNSDFLKYVKELYDLVDESVLIDVRLFSMNDNILFGDINTYKVVGVYSDNKNQNI